MDKLREDRCDTLREEEDVEDAEDANGVMTFGMEKKYVKGGNELDDLDVGVDVCCCVDVGVDKIDVDVGCVDKTGVDVGVDKIDVDVGCADNTGVDVGGLDKVDVGKNFRDIF